MNSTTRRFYLVVPVLVIAAIFRLNHVTQPFIDAFSWRQASTAMMANNYYHSNWNIFLPEVNWGGIGPSYQGREFQTVSYIAALLYCIFGQHDWVGRLVAISFGLWGIFAFYQLVSEIYGEHRALTSATVFAILPGSIFIDRSFLPDSAMVALVITGFWLLVVYFKTENRIYLFLAGLITTWGFLTKITGLMIGIPMLYVSISYIRQRKETSFQNIFPLVATVLSSLIIVTAYYLWALHLSLNFPPYHFAGAGNWLWDIGLSSLFKNIFFLPKLSYHIKTWLWTYFSIFVACIGTFLLPFLPNSEKNKRRITTPWVFHWWLLSSILYYLIGSKELVDNPWNLHLFSPMISSFIGDGIASLASFIASRVMSLPKYCSRQYVVIAVTAGMLVLFSMVSHARASLNEMYHLSWKDESYQIGIILHDASREGDLVVTIASDIGDPNMLYYSKRRGWTFPPARANTDWSTLPESDAESIRIFDDMQLQGAAWLGISDRQLKNLETHHPKLINHIRQNSQRHSQNSFGAVFRISLRDRVHTAN